MTFVTQALTRPCLFMKTCGQNHVPRPGAACVHSAFAEDAHHDLLLSLLRQRTADRAEADVHGVAGDLACRRRGERAMLVSDLIDSLGEAFRAIGGKSFV